MASLVRPDPIPSRSRPFHVGPLVRAIAREIRERSSALILREAAVTGCGFTGREQRRTRLLEADASSERRGLEHAEAELANLGCTIVAWSPLTIALERQRRKELWMLEDG